MHYRFNIYKNLDHIVQKIWDLGIKYGVRLSEGKTWASDVGAPRHTNSFIIRCLNALQQRIQSWASREWLRLLKSWSGRLWKEMPSRAGIAPNLRICCIEGMSHPSEGW